MGIRKMEIPVFFHNGKGYDNHFISQAISRLEDIESVKLSVIPDNSEKYKMVNFRGYRFLDSISFLNSGLGTLSNNMIGDDPKIAPRFHKAFSHKGLSEDELIRVTRKGVFPTSGSTRWSSWNTPCRRPKRSFSTTCQARNARMKNTPKLNGCGSVSAAFP
jgi:hypothetical protein